MLVNEYDNEHKIACTYLKKLQQWSTIKSGHVNALHELSLFLIGCNNYSLSIGPGRCK